MAKDWYPVIDYKKCINCGKCVQKCQQCVYDKGKLYEPYIIKQAGCIQGCHGCGNLCPVGAITYFGENTDWKPLQDK